MSLPEDKWKQLMWLCEQKIWIKPPEEDGPVPWAVKGGHYLGAPGKEIFYSLPALSDEQWDALAEKHARQWPSPLAGEPYKTPGNHVGYAACIRYIYGQFEKQGVLRSKQDKQRMTNSGVNWDLPRKFMDTLKEKWLENDCHYGLCIAYEMEGHRLGDEVVINKDLSKLQEMEKCYLKSVEYASMCNSYKQMFTPYYWASRYFMEAKDMRRACNYSEKAIVEAEKHCPDARGSYVAKIVVCANYLKKNNPKKWKRIQSMDIQNRCVKKMMSKMRK